MISLLRIPGYLWALPNTLLGCLFIPVAYLSGGRARAVRGTVEIHGRAIAWLLRSAVPLAGGASALTLGHIVLGCDEADLARCREHELAHVRQYERWGPFFIPAYLVASLLAYTRRGDAYIDNYFEREARRAADL